MISVTIDVNSFTLGIFIGTLIGMFLIAVIWFIIIAIPKLRTIMWMNKFHHERKKEESKE